MIFNSFIKYPKNTSYAGEDRDEKIYYVFRSAMITNVPWMLLVVVLVITPFLIADMLPTIVRPEFRLILTVFWYLITFGYAFQRFLNWFFNVYIISNKKIIDVDFYGIFYKNISETPLRNVEDVTSTIKGAAGIIFNIGDVYIQTAAEKREFEFTNVYDPSNLRDLISDLAEKKKKSGGKSGGKG